MAPKRTFDLDDLHTAIPTIFDQAQTSAVTHKKNCVALYKLQCGAATVTESSGKGRHATDVKLVGEKAFADAFVDMLSRVLVMKKGIPAADRIVKFVGAYAKFLFEKSSNPERENHDNDDSPTSRFLSRLLKYLMKGTTSKDKNVRYRVVALISEVVVYLGEIDQDVYSELRSSLLERLHDKESLVRTSCVAALCKLSASEDPEEIDDGDGPIIAHLVDSLCYDTAVEVRRAALVHVPFLPTTLPALLTRMRDVDAVTRKLVYTTVLPRLAHPKQLTIAQREGVVRHGLGDREEAVRVAAAKLLGSWVDVCEGSLKDFLQLFDVGSTEVAIDALKSVFVTRAEIVSEMEFDDTFWSNLSPETALLARSFVEHCIATQDQSKLESALPVVTALAFHVQSQFNSYLALLQEAEESRVMGGENAEEQEAREDQMTDVEFMIGELLQLATHLDYADEIGRRKMFGVVREMIAHAQLPDSLVKPCVGVLEVLSPNERDLVRLVVEVINEIRDSNSIQSGDETAMEANISTATTSTQQVVQRLEPRTRRQPHEMTAEEREQADVADLRCLSLCVEVLEKVNGSFEENSTLEGILADLIIPAVKRKELALRAKGLISLGLCCLIAKNMAINSFQLFLNQIKSAPEPLRIKVLQIVFDIMMSYDKELLGETEIGQRITAFLMQVLEAEESNAVQAVICLGFAKMMLYGLVVDERVLLCLVMAYVSPMTADNQELRQCLAYFLPVYCYSSAYNQDRMRCLFITAYDVVKRMHEDLEEDQDMIAPLQFGELFVDWTDPSKSASSSNQQAISSPVHLNLASDIIKALYDSDRPADDKKIFCQLLGKVGLLDDVDQTVLYPVHILGSYLDEQCPLDDSTAEKAFAKFTARMSKLYAKELDEFDEHECFGSEDYRELYEFIGVAVPHKAKRKIKQVKTSPVEATLAASEEEEGERGEEEEEVSDEETPKSKRARSSHRRQETHSEESDGQVASTDDASILSDTNDTRHRKAGKKISVKKGRVKQTRTNAVSDSGSEQVTNESETPEPEHHADENNREPSTPVKSHKSAKRLHSPTKNPTMASPARKRVKPASRKQNGQTKSQPAEPLSNVVNQQEHGNSRSVKQQPQRDKRAPNKSASPEPSEGVSDEESDVSVLGKIPRVKERIGWDGSNDI